MLFQATSLIGLPIGCQETRSKIGEILQIIINPEKGSLLAFLVKPLGFFSSPKLLSPVDVIEYDKAGIVCKSHEDLALPKEIVRAKKILDSGIKILGINARTTSGTKLGKVEDFLINTETSNVTKYYLKNWFETRIISADKVIKIDRTGLIFDDDASNGELIREAETA